MLTNLEDAKKIISKVHTGYNRVTEYGDVFLFWKETDEEFYGGADASKGVLKKNGEVLSMPQLVMGGYKKGKPIRELEIDLSK